MIDTQNSTQGFEFRTVQDLNKEKDRKDLGQQDFLKLMTAQLQNQDPFKPMESGDFLAQIAQFSTVEGIGELNSGFSQLSESLVSNQALQASHMIGREVLAPTGVASLQAGSSVQGQVDLPAASSEVTVNIYDQAGQLIRRMQMGPQSAGPVDFRWDGLRDDGSYAAPGNYFISAEAAIDGRTEALETLVASRVRSVTLSNSGGLLLDLDGVGSLDFSEVRQIL
ncbi:MAG TPA: flagellar hook assembly protein FlgD [Gammaproteobacteria bacterium]|nr:flagellar hook assembly protein FlgD [Gammaproteobacteria bacterium]